MLQLILIQNIQNIQKREKLKNINVSIPSKITTALTLNLYPNISKYILHIAL